MKPATLYSILLILALAFFLRVYQSGSHGLYLDEKYTMVISQGIVMEGANQKDVFFTPGKTYFTPAEFWKEKTFSDFIEANIRGDIGNSPVYYGFLWLWMKVFGLGDFAVRLLSVVFSTLGVGMLYLFVKRHLKSESLALLSAFIAAIEPFFVAYSHMARNYSLSFLLTLVATHVFLLIVEKLKTKSPARNLYILYGFLLILSLLSHYLTLTVFLAHGIYVLFYVRFRQWFPLLLTVLASVGVVSLWFIFGGGKYTFQTLAHQAQLYRGLAQTNPFDNPYAIILPATLQNVAVKSLPLWADLLIIFNGLGQIDTLGIRNMAIALTLGICAVFVLKKSLTQEKPSLLLVALFAFLLVAGLPFYTVARPQYIVLSTLPSFFYLLLRHLRKSTYQVPTSLLVFLFVLATIPTLFLIVMAFKNNHTYGLTQRYSGFSFPYSILFVAMILREVVSLPKAFQVVFGLVLAVQAYFVVDLLVRLYQDRAPKYTYFVNPRGPNPYALTAEKIMQKYAPGDTILYPSIKLNPMDEIEKTYYPYSIMDAQLTNLYLPKDAAYWQRMDTTQTDQVLLLKGDTGKKIVLFDFEGRKHRY
ncbi:hypothetical protein EZE20_07220 [Arundinibacter roseus]|uniref:Glycosyltransferase RgtA/B/C/D-like domain-containing protein n=2 Tax=Arundinibacter roseus TaxID=2070510 RepID=A0A4R4KGF8_9BACT|nr:hypothetical protein EZE20_07220 [Arundinibacter roseus]